MLNKNDVCRLPAVLKWYQLTNLILLAFLFAVPFSFSPGANYWAIVWGFLVFLTLPIFIIILLLNRAVSFTFDDTKITIKRGVLIKDTTIIPFDKVQNVKEKSGILLSMFGLSGINIWTASQSQISQQSESKPDGYLKLKKEDSKILAEIILKKNN